MIIISFLDQILWYDHHWNCLRDNSNDWSYHRIGREIKVFFSISPYFLVNWSPAYSLTMLYLPATTPRQSLKAPWKRPTTQDPKNFKNHQKIISYHYNIIVSIGQQLAFFGQQFAFFDQTPRSCNKIHKMIPIQSHQFKKCWEVYTNTWNVKYFYFHPVKQFPFYQCDPVA